MDTGKQINAMVVVLLLTVALIGFYALFDPFRADTAEDDQLEKSAERGATTFALNCRLCHGDSGQGGAAGGRLPAAPALDRPDLQGIQDGGFNPAVFDETFNWIFDTIMCGRAGTAMPTWGRAQGGTLSDEQIRQLVVLIMGGDLGADPYHEGGFWELAQEHADELDAQAAEHATLQMPDGFLSPSATEITVSNAAPLAPGQYIRVDDERMQVLNKMIEVERGVGGTDPAAHASGTAFLRDGAETGKTLAEDADAAATELIIDDTRAFSAGETLQLGDELVRVRDVITGVPTTNQALIRDVGREPEELYVSGADGISVGDMVRIDHELVEVTGIREDGDLGITLDVAATASSDVISVSDPDFFSSGYVVHAGSEQIEVIGPLGTGQVLGATIGRAETTISVSGSAGIEVGSRIRMGAELLEVRSLQPATVSVERGADDLDGNAAPAASHSAGAAIVKLVEEPEDGAEPEEPDTGQTLLDAIDAAATTMVVSGTSGIAIGQTYQIGNELVEVTGIEPAILRVRRGVGGTEAAEHARRVPIFLDNFLAVERGAVGTAAAMHDAGTDLLFDVLEVERAAGDTEPEDHSKDAEIFRGHVVIVERGALGTDAAEHENGAPVFNFPAPPQDPATTPRTCGNNPPLAPPNDDQGDQPRDGATQIGVSLLEFQVVADAESAPAEEIDFTVVNDGATIHNFRVAATDLAPDALPLAGQVVDEEQFDEVLGFSDALAAGDERLVNTDLAPGNYVLFCNVPTHYGLGMYTGFEVAAP